MAQTAKSLILYGFEVNASNNNISFDVGAGTLTGTLSYGFYSFDSLAVELLRVMTELAPAVIFTYSIDRTYVSGTEARITITASSVSFTINFNQPSSVGPTLGYNSAVYSGATSYTSATSPGSSILTEREVYTYLGPEFQKQVLGAVNISATGLKEAVVFQVMQFISFEVKFEPQAKVIAQWEDFWTWAIQQRVFEFTPSVADPNVVYQVTLEKTGADGKGLAYRMTEMLPEFPFYYRSGVITLRRQVGAAYIV